MQLSRSIVVLDLLHVAASGWNWNVSISHNSRFYEIIVTVVNNIPLLRDILPGPDRQPPISLSLLAKELNVPVEKIIPLVEHGYLRSIDPTTIEAPSPAALLWLRSWFQPAMAKGLFSARDIADILSISEKAIPALAAAHDAPVTVDPALGMVFSVWAARKLILEVLGDGVRFDRGAILHFLLDGQKPCPPFSESVELEIERISKLEEPARSIRKEAFLDAWKAAEAFAGVQAPDGIKRAMRRL